MHGIDLYYEVHEAQDANSDNWPLMLVAGPASDSQSWLPVLSRLAATRTVILLNNRGCGRTTPQDIANSIHRIAEDCVALADHLGIDRFDLVGHSMGGFVAIDCALHHPRRVACLVLANSAASNRPRNVLLFGDWLDDLRLSLNPERWFRTFFYCIFTPRFFDKPSQVDDFVRFALAYPYPQTTAGFAAQVKAMRDVDFTDALR